MGLSLNDLTIRRRRLAGFVFNSSFLLKDSKNERSLLPFLGSPDGVSDFPNSDDAPIGGQ